LTGGTRLCILSTMSSTSNEEELNSEIERGGFDRAAALSEMLGLEPSRIRELQQKALWQMAAVYRNASGTRKLASRYGFSRDEVENILDELAREERKNGEPKTLEPCYEQRSGRYLSFEEWKEALLKDWDRLPTS